MFDLIVIGGGAAGFYGAIQAAELYPGLKILILEKTGKLLSKVKVSGGGRCNVTHRCFDAPALSRHYPRGEKELRSIFKRYHAKDTVEWFASRRVELKTENDGRMFPVSDRSQTIIDCFLSEAQRLNISIRTGSEVRSIRPLGDHFEITTSSSTFQAPKILIATGGSPREDAYAFIRGLGHSIKQPIPSLFTFNDPDRRFASLMGVSVPNAEVRIATTKYSQEGPLLITHWGLSGPAVIRLSAWAAEYLHAVNYHFTAIISWIGRASEEEVRQYLLAQKSERAKQRIHANPLYGLPQRLWEVLCSLAEIPAEKIWAEVSNRNINKLLENLIRCAVGIKGKTTFKEEFVTCGGVPLSEVNLETMESKLVPGIFFAGEVLDIDGETGGFNFQAAWSTGFVAAMGIEHAK